MQLRVAVVLLLLLPEVILIMTLFGLFAGPV